MERALQTRIVSRLLDHLKAGTTDCMPEEMYHPATSYTDPQVAAAERDALFKRLPLIACVASELPNPHDFVTVDLVGVPALIVRQPDRSLKAFVNVCRHRGAKVETAERGNRKLFVCPFHAWSYDGQGGLRGVPFAEGFCNMDRKERGLNALPVEERHGLVWVVPTPGGTIDVAAHLGAQLDGILTGWGVSSFVKERRQSFDVPVNWKLLMDGFLEDYHIPVLHQGTIGPYFQPHLHAIDTYGPHGSMIAARANITKLADRPPEEIDLRRCAAAVYAIFPASVLIWLTDHFELWTILPDRHDPLRAHATAWLLAPSTETAQEQRDLWDRNWKILMDTVQQEDWVAAREIQSSIAGGAQSHFVFGRNEAALQHFHKQIGAAVAAI